jgi:general secretion pathway protein D
MPTLYSVPTVRVDVLIVSAPQERVLPLLPRLRDPAQIEAAQAELLAMVSRKEAVLEGWPDVITHSGIRAVSEAIVEHRYPIEFDPVPSGVHQSLQSSNQTSATADSKQSAKAGGDQGLDRVVPTTFETRNTGVTLEVEPVVSPDQKAVTIFLCPQVVRLERNIDYPAGTSPRGEKITVPQPIFTTSKINTSVSLRDGERRLLHVGKANQDAPRVELFIVGAKISAPASAVK